MRIISVAELEKLSAGGFWSDLGKLVGYALHSYVDNWGYSDASHYTRKI